MSKSSETHRCWPRGTEQTERRTDGQTNGSHHRIMPATLSVSGHITHTHTFLARYEVVTQRQQRSQAVEETAEAFYVSRKWISKLAPQQVTLSPDTHHSAAQHELIPGHSGNYFESTRRWIIATRVLLSLHISHFSRFITARPHCSQCRALY